MASGVLSRGPTPVPPTVSTRSAPPITPISIALRIWDRFDRTSTTASTTKPPSLKSSATNRSVSGPESSLWSPTSTTRARRGATRFPSARACSTAASARKNASSGSPIPSSRAVESGSATSVTSTSVTSVTPRAASLLVIMSGSANTSRGSMVVIPLVIYPVIN